MKAHLKAKHLVAISLGATGAEGEARFPLLSHYDGLKKQVDSVQKENVLACPLPMCSAALKGKRFEKGTPEEEADH